jgi:outer membrane protein assembly factor BamB
MKSSLIAIVTVGALLVILSQRSVFGQTPAAASAPATSPTTKAAPVPGASAALKAGAAGALLGSANFKPSPDRPVGWRGDGTGRYPGATPPTTWERKREGAGYTTKGIVWAAPLPNTGVASPIIVGDKIFVTGEEADLICLDKQTGKILWIRSNPAFEGLSEEERKANAQLAPLADQLEKANLEVVDALNALTPKSATTAFTPPAALARKRELEKQILAQVVALAGKKDAYGLYGAQGVFGYAGPTPVSDGKRVLVLYATGIIAAYDLDGKRKWIKRVRFGGAEHGSFASPILCDNQFIIGSGADTCGYNADTGEARWDSGQGANSYSSPVLIRSGGESVAVFGSGLSTRLRDGKSIWNPRAFTGEIATPVVEGDLIYADTKVGQESEFKAYRIPADTNGGTPKPAFTLKADWGGELGRDNFACSYVASPLVAEGLTYRLSEGGGLMVNDAATGEKVYHKVLPMKAHTAYWDAAGASASPALAGKYIYLMDNQGITVVIQPGREYKEVAKNLLEEIESPNWKAPGGKSQSQMLASPVFEGARMYYRSPSYLYCIGEK